MKRRAGASDDGPLRRAALPHGTAPTSDSALHRTDTGQTFRTDERLAHRTDREAHRTDER